MEDYEVIEWPESQYVMEMPWYDECILINDQAGLAKYGYSAYLVPKNRVEELKFDNHT